MKKKIAIFTGARSEYGILKNLIRRIEQDEDLSYSLYVTGIHLLNKFGNTYQEIEKDEIKIDYKIPIFQEDIAPGVIEFANAIASFGKVLEEDQPDGVFIIGDRPEAYAMALAAHFKSVKIYHSGGGTVTKGAVDNIYRYNITNLSTYHIATSKANYERLIRLPVIEKKEVFFTGSFAIDAIQRFLFAPKEISEFLPQLDGKRYCLMTFHPVTFNKEDISGLMRLSIDTIISQGYDILLTYPNNDPGYELILEEIDRWENHPNIVIIENLGALRYYASLYSCSFVIGNSSSGIIEAPYFHKPVINIGTRQHGRECDKSVNNVSANPSLVKQVILKGFKEKWKKIKNNNIYGSGNAMEQIIEILKK